MAAVMLAIVGLTAVRTQSHPTVQVSGGMIRGLLTDGGGAAFKGIPYAEPPVGDLRWREPTPARGWTGTRDATQFGAICPQHPSATIPNAAEIAKEDCLFLNVWIPAWPVTENRPVLLWIPGGGNINGGTTEARHDGSSLARRGIVVVTINYRLGSFGFFSHPALTAESQHRASGNQGLLDQVAALDWVRANISPFGGDPNAITIGGVSAGELTRRR
jgi:para-nitrobenzyl esterase